MNEEIKEILDFLEGIVNERYAMPNEQELLNEKEIKVLLDYITNLQEKYEEADNDRHKLFEQKEKAIEYIEHLDNVFIDSEKQDNILNILQGSDKE